MLRFYENDNIFVDDVHNEIKYTYLLMDSLKKEYPNDDLSLIIGADNVINFNRWKNYQELLKYHLIIMQRNGIDVLKYLKEYHIDKYTIIDNYPYIDISSTIIKQDLNNKYLDKSVLKYIIDNNLYKE